MTIVNNEVYNIIYVSISFEGNEDFLHRLKKEFSVEIPYIDLQNLNDTLKPSLDSYIYILNNDKYKETYTKLCSKYRRITFTSLGIIKGSEISKFFGNCENVVSNKIKIGAFYKITRGVYKNLIVEALKVNGNNLMSQVELLGKQHPIKVSLSDVVEVENYPLVNRASQFKNYLELSMKENQKKAIIIDGNHILYRSMFGYNRLYTIKDNKFIGGAFGFYFTLLKLKEMFVEYEIHIVFDGYPANKFLDNPGYKSNRQKYSPEFRKSFKENQEWVKSFSSSVGFGVYQIEDKEADDVIGSLVKFLLKDGYQHILIHSSDTDFYQLVSDKVHLFKPKETFRGFPEKVTIKEALFKFGVNNIFKINWFRAIRGDVSDSIPSINTFYFSKGISLPKIKTTDYLNLINESQGLNFFKEKLLANETFNKFVSLGQFDLNFNLLELDCSIFNNLIELTSFFKTPDDSACYSLLEKYSLFKEIEMFEKNMRILKGVW